MACDPTTLVDQAKCIECGIPTGMQLPVLIALAAQIAGVSADPQTLMNLAKCDECQVPVGLEWPVLIALACQIAGV